VELVAEDEIEVLMVILMKFQMLKKDMEWPEDWGGGVLIWGGVGNKERLGMAGEGVVTSIVIGEQHLIEDKI
jgi:hypothetical protein